MPVSPVRLWPSAPDHSRQLVPQKRLVDGPYTSGSGSVVEHHLAKVRVGGSNPLFRSIFSSSRSGGMVDAAVSKTVGGNPIRVRLSASAPNIRHEFTLSTVLQLSTAPPCRCFDHHFDHHLVCDCPIISPYLIPLWGVKPVDLRTPLSIYSEVARAITLTKPLQDQSTRVLCL